MSERALPPLDGVLPLWPGEQVDRLLVLDRVGHVAQMERPELVARAFLEMLEQIASRPAA